MTTLLLFTPRPRVDRTPMDQLFQRCHERLIDCLQAGRSTDAYHYTRLVSFLAQRLQERHDDDVRNSVGAQGHR